METDITIAIHPDGGYYQRCMAVEAAAIWGLCAPRVCFPAAAPGRQGTIVVAPAQVRPEGLVKRDGSLWIYVADSRASVDRLCRALLEGSQEYLGLPDLPREVEAPGDYRAASDHPRPVPPADPRHRKGLESLFEVGPLLVDTDSDWLPDDTRFQLLLPPSLSLSQTIAACNLAMRLGAETLGLTCPVTAEEDRGTGGLIRLAEGEVPCITLEEETRPVVALSGDGPALEEFSQWLCSRFPRMEQGHTWAEYMEQLDKSVRLDTLDGQLAALAARQGQGVAQCSFSLEGAPLEQLKARFPMAEFSDYRAAVPAARHHRKFEWEVDGCRRLLRERVYPRLSPGDRVDIQMVLSEGRQVRTDLAAEVEADLAALGVIPGRVDALCAYKQGYSWIDEKILPALAGRKGEVAAVEITFRPFLPPQGEVWMDLPIRFLQELYPIDDRIAQCLSLDTRQIRFVQGTPDQGDTYVFRARSADGAVLLEEGYSVSVSQRPYMACDPASSLVHPSTGRLSVAVNGTSLLERAIPTDLEQIWDFYQQTVLPDCCRYIDRACGGTPTPEQQPFFARLELELSLSEPDDPLPFRQDRISSVDAFHEELYFFALAYLNRYGQTRCGTGFQAPGLILPVIHLCAGPPRITAVLYRQEGQRPGLAVGGIPADGPGEARAVVQAIRWREEAPEVVIRVDGPDGKALAPFLRAYGQLLEEGLLSAGPWLAGCGRLTLTQGGEMAASVALPPPPHQAPLSIADIDLMEDRIIDYPSCCRIVEQLRRVPGLQVWEAAQSYQGRAIYAIEILPTGAGYTSRAKRINRNPTKCVVARHHANEVSSTNACFQLLRRLLLDPVYAGLGDRLNLVLIPMENPDGTAIQSQLYRAHPHWKLHTARFNALGREFAGEYFREDTIHTEALAFTRVFRCWVPDLVVDNHGVPSHEWDQQFSGYTPPAFREFWLPRALLHGYFWQIEEEDYRANRDLNDRLEQAIAAAVGACGPILEQNQVWRERYEKYAHRWLPELFPAQYVGDMICYRYPFPYTPGRYVSVSYPWLTTACFTSEAADETAQGDYLALCARTHLCHDLASTDLLLTSRCVYHKTLEVLEDGVRKRIIRRRPVLLPPPHAGE